MKMNQLFCAICTATLNFVFQANFSAVGERGSSFMLIRCIFCSLGSEQLNGNDEEVVYSHIQKSRFLFFLICSGYRFSLFFGCGPYICIDSHL
jgi:hypothetical protein